MSNLQMWSLIVGFFLPVVIGVVQQSHWPDGLRAIVAFVACLGAAAGTVLIESGWSWKHWVDSALLILVTSISTYKGMWRPLAITGRDLGIEKATNFRSATR